MLNTLVIFPSLSPSPFSPSVLHNKAKKITVDHKLFSQASSFWQTCKLEALVNHLSMSEVTALFLLLSTMACFSHMVTRDLPNVVFQLVWLFLQCSIVFFPPYFTHDDFWPWVCFLTPLLFYWGTEREDQLGGPHRLREGPMHQRGAIPGSEVAGSKRDPFFPGPALSSRTCATLYLVPTNIY